VASFFCFFCRSGNPLFSPPGFCGGSPPWGPILVFLLFDHWVSPNLVPPPSPLPLGFRYMGVHFPCFWGALDFWVYGPTPSLPPLLRPPFFFSTVVGSVVPGKGFLVGDFFKTLFDPGGQSLTFAHTGHLSNHPSLPWVLSLAPTKSCPPARLCNTAPFPTLSISLLPNCVTKSEGVFFFFFFLGFRLLFFMEVASWNSFFFHPLASPGGCPSSPSWRCFVPIGQTLSFFLSLPTPWGRPTWPRRYFSSQLLLTPPSLAEINPLRVQFGS